MVQNYVKVAVRDASQLRGVDLDVQRRVIGALARLRGLARDTAYQIFLNHPVHVLEHFLENTVRKRHGKHQQGIIRFAHIAFDGYCMLLGRHGRGRVEGRVSESVSVTQRATVRG